jgi:hypothetical protein
MEMMEESPNPPARDDSIDVLVQLADQRWSTKKPASEARCGL